MGVSRAQVFDMEASRLGLYSTRSEASFDRFAEKQELLLY